MLFQTVQCVIKYMQGPTYISSEIVPQKEAGFPAMTVCPVSSSKGYKVEVLRENGIESYKKYNWKVNLTWSSNFTNVSDVELFQMATHRFDELVKRVYVRFFEADVSI